MSLLCVFVLQLFQDSIFSLEWNRKNEEEGEEKRKRVRSRRDRLIEVEEGKGGTIHREGTERKSKTQGREERQGGEVIF